MKHRSLFPFLVSCLTMAACNAVDLAPTRQYDRSYGFTSVDHAERYLDSFYPLVRDFSPYGSHALGGSNGNLSDGLTDILKYGSIVAGAGDPNLIMTVDGQQSVSQNYFDAWTSCYGWIRRINEFLDGLSEHAGAFSAAEHDRLEAEARFFRGYAYFLILRAHGSEKDDLGAILYRDIHEMTPLRKDTPRAGLSDSWDLVEADLSFAARNLAPPTGSGRVHADAAQALLARAMLYAGRHDKAENAARAVVESGRYGFVPEVSAPFRDLGSPEVIWGIAYAKGSLTHTFDAQYSQPGDICLSGSYGGGKAGPTQEFVDAFDYADGRPFAPGDPDRYLTPENIGTRDPRLSAAVLYHRATWKGRTLACCEGGTDQKYMPYGQVNSPGNTVTGYYMRKLLDESNRDYVVDGSYQGWPELRYAEQVLILSECLARRRAYDEAREWLAALRRARFGRDDVAVPEMTSWETSLDALLHERLVELCYEGHRFWDLRRTGRAAAVLDGKRYSGVLWKADGDGWVPTPVSCDMGARHYPDRFDRFPLPQNEISNNRQARQNADW